MRVIAKGEFLKRFVEATRPTREYEKQAIEIFEIVEALDLVIAEPSQKDRAIDRCRDPVKKAVNALRDPKTRLFPWQ